MTEKEIDNRKPNDINTKKKDMAEQGDANVEENEIEGT